MDILTKLKEHHEKYKGTLVLEGFNVSLFRGMILDQDDDYYYDILEYRKSKSVWCSACIGVIFLKDYLEKEDYEHLVHVWNLNNEEQAQ